MRMKASGIVVLAAIMAGCAADAPQPTPVAALPPGPVMHLVVHGMGCPMCATNIEQQLKQVDGVRAVGIDLHSGLVDLTIDPAHPPEQKQISDAINRSGFTLVELQVR